MYRFNSFSPGQKAILVGISGIHENPRFPSLSWSKLGVPWGNFEIAEP
jgi:hypothetical protein